MKSCPVCMGTIYIEESETKFLSYFMALCKNCDFGIWQCSEGGKTINFHGNSYRYNTSIEKDQLIHYAQKMGASFGVMTVSPNEGDYYDDIPF